MSAVLLGINRALELWGSRGSDHSVFGQVMALSYAPLFGASASAAVLMTWRIATGGPPFPREPGHWLLVVSGVTAIASLSVRGVFAALTTERLWPIDFLVIRCGVSLLGIAFNLMAAVKLSSYWRFTFGIAVALNLVTLLASVLIGIGAFEFGRYLDTATYVLLTLSVVIAAAIDLAKRTPRDYLHWTGVVVRVIYTVLTIATPFLVALLRTRVE